jgi:steroid delta-isomerase-like uncharacterized protein
MPTTPEAANLAAFRRFHAATNSGDLEQIAEAIDALVSSDAVVHSPIPSEATGRQLLKDVWARLLHAYPDLRITVHDLLADEDKGACRQSVTATHLGEYMGVPPTGRSVTYDEMFVLRFVDGRIAETWGVVDVLSQMRQLGAIAC